MSKAIKQISAVFILLFAGFVANSQDKEKVVSKLATAPAVETEQQNIKIKREKEPAHTVYFVADASAVLNSWRSYVKDKMDQKLSKQKGLYTSENFMYAGLSTGPISLYSDVVTKDDGSQLQVWVKSGEQFVDHKNFPDISQKLDTFLKEFANQFYAQHYSEVIDSQEDEVKDLSKSLGKMEKTAEKMADEIDDNQKDIKKNEKNTSKAEKEIEKLQKEIEAMKKENEEKAKANEKLQKDIKDQNKKIEEHKKELEQKQSRVENLKSNAKKYK